VAQERVGDDLSDRDRTTGLGRFRRADGPSLIALPLHPDGSALEVDVRDLQAQQLTDPQARSGEDDDRRREVRRHRLGHLLHLLDRRRHDLLVRQRRESNAAAGG
jgi:hypothetical protein